MQRKWECNDVEFNEGDRVMVVGYTFTNDPNGMGKGRQWRNCWLTEMEQYIFKEYTIDYIDIEGVHFVEPEDVCYYSFPLNVLKNLSKEALNVEKEAA